MVWHIDVTIVMDNWYKDFATQFWTYFNMTCCSPFKGYKLQVIPSKANHSDTLTESSGVGGNPCHATILWSFLCESYINLISPPIRGGGPLFSLKGLYNRMLYAVTFSRYAVESRGLYLCIRLSSWGGHQLSSALCSIDSPIHVLKAETVHAEG